MCILLRAKKGGCHFICGVIDSADQSQVWAAALEPVMATAINLQQHACLGASLAATAVLGVAPSSWAANTRSAQDALNRRTRDGDAFHCTQFLSQVRLVEASVGCLGQRNHPLADIERQGVVWHTSTIAMDSSLRTLLAESCK